MCLVVYNAYVIYVETTYYFITQITNIVIIAIYQTRQLLLQRIIVNAILVRRIKSQFM